MHPAATRAPRKRSYGRHLAGEYVEREEWRAVEEISLSLSLSLFSLSPHVCQPSALICDTVFNFRAGRLQSR